jgi:hypothetical protein
VFRDQFEQVYAASAVEAENMSYPPPREFSSMKMLEIAYTYQIYQTVSSLHMASILHLSREDINLHHSKVTRHHQI